MIILGLGLSIIRRAGVGTASLIKSFIWGTSTSKNWGESTSQTWG